MNALPRHKPLTVREFLARAENAPDGKFELHGGEIVAMAPERVGHAQAKFAIAAALKTAIRKGGLPCEAFVDGIGVAVNDYTTYIPDALVHCGERLPRDAMLATAPVIIVEVLSPSSKSRDVHTKMREYLALPSVRHYLTLDLERTEVWHHRREPEGDYRIAVVKNGETLHLDPPGITISTLDIFEDGSAPDDTQASPL